MEVISPSADISGTLTLAPGDLVILVRITTSGTTPATGTLELLEGNDFASQTAVLGSQKSIIIQPPTYRISPEVEFSLIALKIRSTFL